MRSVSYEIDSARTISIDRRLKVQPRRLVAKTVHGLCRRMDLLVVAMTERNDA
jgi:hypothetical protein